MGCEHGSYKISTRPNNVVVLDARGPWNAEAVNSYHLDMVKVVERFKGQPWRHIAILRCETLFIPEVTSFLLQHFVWRKALPVFQTL